MSDQLIDDYLRDLRVSAWVRRMPKSETAALENETREKIAAELAAAGNRDEETVYGVLDRLGPAADIVGQKDMTSPSGAVSTLNSVLAPVARLQFRLAARGWGLAEFGGLVLLIAGPYLLWWVGPIIGIILIRSYADRWSERAEHNATVVVFGLLAVQAIVAIALFVYALTSGGSLADQLQRVISGLAPFSGSGPTIEGPLVLVRVVGSALAPIAGLVAGVYLALSPRIRR
jgi:hypothetical protein